ncbi:hypothetical protein SOVF_054600 [Spinacia oleracea]|nr:hypothetical protein SOVF_054600 [Spinacia oleracea]
MHQSSPFYQFLKKLIQFSISFSVFSILFMHPSCTPLFYSLISHLSTFSSQLLSLATDKNYIFLLCNGILVFIAKYSCHTVDTCPPPLSETSPNNDLYYKAYRQSMQSSTEKSLLMEDVATNEDENENGSEGNDVISEEDEEEKHVVYQITDGTEDDNEEDVISDCDNNEYMKENPYRYDNNEYMKESSYSWSFEEQEKEDNYEKEEDEAEQEEEEAIAEMSTEELNRKFDDFIRKMKEELRIEAQQQLIVV